MAHSLQHPFMLQNQYHLEDTYTLLNVDSRLIFILAPFWPQLLCVDPREILHKRFHPRNVGLMSIIVKISALANQHQLFQQSKGFTLVVIVSWQFITEVNKSMHEAGRCKKTLKHRLRREASYWLSHSACFLL